MTLTSTEQPSDQFLQLWQAYCDKKSECEDLHERISELEAEKARLIEAYVPCPSATEAYMYGITQEKQG